MEPGTELGVSAWHKVTQEDINAFAELTEDKDPYHTGPEYESLSAWNFVLMF